jgi:ABC-2 type transport system permease protein
VLRILLSTTSLHLQQKLLHREFWLQLFLERIFPLAIPLLAWLSVFQYAQSEKLVGWEQNEMIAYYLLVFIIGLFTDIQFHYEMSTMVHMGTLNQWLIRPLSFLETVVSHISARIIILLIPGTVALLLSIWLFPGILSSLSFSSVVNACLALPLSLALFGLISATVGMLAFWIIKTDSFFALIMLILEFLGGRLLPLDLLPDWLQYVSHFLPLRFAIAGPVDVILHPETSSIMPLLFGQSIWCLLLFGFALLLWRMGIRRYDAIGS